jgi:spore germination protein GerM
MARRLATAIVLTILTSVLAWLLFVGLPRWYGAPAATRAVAATPSPSPPPPGRKIKTRLYYVAEDGMHLTAVEREVSYGEGTVEQARQILEAQIAPASEPLVSAVPAGTKLRSVFVTPRGEAYVDLSREVAAAHGGGSLDELLTVYTIVYALTENLPAVNAVQLLVDGKEVDTLAGHVDLRRPIAKDPEWVE